MREDIFRIFKKIWIEKIKRLSQSIDFDQTLTLCKIREEKGEETKIIFLETGEKKENFDIKIIIFRKELDLL